MKSRIKDELLNAAERIKPYIHRTPVLTSHTIDALAGAELFFKCENFQKMGAFKMRGAMNALLLLTPPDQLQGVATHSSGNFAQALALAARNIGVKAYIVMPEDAPQIKKNAVAGYGAEIIESKPGQKAREEMLERVLQKTGACFIHPYNNINVIHGNSTAALELLEDYPDLDAVIAPVGGGGLLSGTALAAKLINPEIEIFAGEPSAADDAFRSIQTGIIQPSINPNTIADGLRTSLGDITFPIIQKLVKEIIRVEEEEIIFAMQLIWERMKIIVEPSAAVGLAAIYKRPELFTNRKIGIILSGGNVELSKLPF